MTEDRHADVRPRDQRDERQRELANLNLLAMARRSRRRTEEQTRHLRRAAHAAALVKLAPRHPDDAEMLAREVADAVLDAVLQVMREGPPADDVDGP